MKKIVTVITVAMMAAMSTLAQAPNDQTTNTPNGQRVSVGLGFVNIADSIKGVQLSPVSNIAEHASGVQLSGFSNVAYDGMKGVQLSVLNNIVIGEANGVQLTGFTNQNVGTLKGVQIAFRNATDTLRGVQIGLFNYVTHDYQKGVQIGLMNYSRDTRSKRYGLINVNPDTRIDVMAFAGTSSKANMALRFRNRFTYNIIGAGTHYMGLDDKFSGTIFYRIGQYFQLTPKLSLSGDVGFFHIETFQEHSTEAPERLYSLEGRLNLDYQLNKKWGVFGTVGYGDTRYYSHNRSFRHRMIGEVGLTYHYGGYNSQKERSLHLHSDEDMTGGDDSRFAGNEGGANLLRTAAMITALNVFVNRWDTWVLGEEFSRISLNSVEHNFRHAFVWDNDNFNTNLFAHPYHGNLYFNAARTNGLTFWESAPYALGGSLMWEFLGETEPPAINDVIATSMGGMAIGEMTHRLSHTILDDRDRGFQRFLREAAAAIVNPIQGLHRIISGDAWRVRSDHYRYHDFNKIPVDVSFSLGWRYLADDGALFRGVHAPYINLTLMYGTPVDGERHTKPYDFFDVESNMAFGGGQPLVNQLLIVGRLWSTPILDKKDMAGEFGIYQHFNYYDAKPIEDGSELTPYRISEAAGFGPGFIFSLPQIGAISKLEQRVFLSGILLGGTKSDYFNVIERDYNMGSGFSIKSKTQIDFGKFGRLVLNAKYFRIYTWKGYEDKDLQAYADGTKDLHYLNVQGDCSNAALLVINPVMEMHLARQWSITLSGAYFSRRTYYKYYDKVHANTFETKLGLTCRL